MNKAEKQIVKEVIHATDIHYKLLRDIHYRQNLSNSDLKDIVDGMAISLDKLEGLVKSTEVIADTRRQARLHRISAQQIPDATVQHRWIEDKTGTGHKRITCICGMTLVCKPWMVERAWLDSVGIFKLNHSS